MNEQRFSDTPAYSSHSVSDQGNTTEDCIDNEFAELVFCNCKKN